MLYIFGDIYIYGEREREREREREVILKKYTKPRLAKIHLPGLTCFDQNQQPSLSNLSSIISR